MIRGEGGSLYGAFREPEVAAKRIEQQLIDDAIQTNL